MTTVLPISKVISESFQQAAVLERCVTESLLLPKPKISLMSVACSVQHIGNEARAHQMQRWWKRWIMGGEEGGIYDPPTGRGFRN